jgi:hypothetical protein
MLGKCRNRTISWDFSSNVSGMLYVHLFGFKIQNKISLEFCTRTTNRFYRCVNCGGISKIRSQLITYFFSSTSNNSTWVLRSLVYVYLVLLVCEYTHGTLRSTFTLHSKVICAYCVFPTVYFAYPIYSMRCACIPHVLYAMYLMWEVFLYFVMYTSEK